MRARPTATSSPGTCRRGSDPALPLDMVEGGTADSLATHGMALGVDSDRPRRAGVAAAAPHPTDVYPIGWRRAIRCRSGEMPLVASFRPSVVARNRESVQTWYKARFDPCEPSYPDRDVQLFLVKERMPSCDAGRRRWLVRRPGHGADCAVGDRPAPRTGYFRVARRRGSLCGWLRSGVISPSQHDRHWPGRCPSKCPPGPWSAVELETACWPVVVRLGQRLRCSGSAESGWTAGGVDRG